MLYDSIAFSQYKIMRSTTDTISINNSLLTEFRWIAASALAVRATQRGKARPRADSLTSPMPPVYGCLIHGRLAVVQTPTQPHESPLDDEQSP